jgi:hypothetical protein
VNLFQADSQSATRCFHGLVDLIFRGKDDATNTSQPITLDTDTPPLQPVSFYEMPDRLWYPTTDERGSTG